MAEILDIRTQMTNPAGRFQTVKPALIGIAVHHSVSGDYLMPDATEAEELLHLKTIDRYHVDQEFGIGYHMAAAASGRLYQLGDLNGARAHVAGRNHELLGLVAIGTFTERLPAERQMDAMFEAVRRLRDFAGRQLPVQGHAAWALPGQGTACPGLLAKVDWEQSGEGAVSGCMHRFNGIAGSLEGKSLDDGIRDGRLEASSEFALPVEARMVRLEVAIVRGGFAVGDGSYAGRVDERYGARLGIIDARLLPGGSLLYDCPPGTVIERIGCIGYWS